MNTTRHEQISALIDGELTDAEITQLLMDRNESELPETWDIYQQIGDVLRSDDLAMGMSANFSRRFSALLEVEPVVLAPQQMVIDTTSTAAQTAPAQRSWNRMYAMGGMAALAATVFIVVQQLNPAGPGRADVAPQLAVMQSSRTGGAETIPASAIVTEASQSGDAAAAQPEPGDMLRDPRIDSYLLAHQKFSPAISKGTRYVNHDATADK